MKYLMSYPRSGNHLVRFFIELLSEMPTLGVDGSEKDISLFQNKYAEPIPFHIVDPAPANSFECYRKTHVPPGDITTVSSLIFIVRNPRECLIRQNGYQTWNQNRNWYSYDSYFQLLEYYAAYQGEKILFYYEDILEHKYDFVCRLYKFLKLHNAGKLDYVIRNIDKLYGLCLGGEGRFWGGSQSNGNTNFYYPRISPKIKPQFDEYIEEKLKKYHRRLGRYALPENTTPVP